MKKFFVLCALGFALAGCDEAATVASRNLSTAADNFELARRITVLDSAKKEPLLVVEGICSQEGDRKLIIVCKDGGDFRKTIISSADRVTILSEQIKPKNVSEYRYRVTINPAQLLPAFEIR